MRKLDHWQSDEQISEAKRTADLKAEADKEDAAQQEALNRFMQFEFARLVSAGELTDEQKEEFIDVFSAWRPQVEYKIGDKVRSEGVVYEVIQAHTSQNDWKPKDVPALFNVFMQKKATTEDGEEVEVVNEWKQPAGGHDAYAKGDKVSFEGLFFESTIDGNIWSPSAYPAGWNQITL